MFLYFCYLVKKEITRENAIINVLDYKKDSLLSYGECEGDGYMQAANRLLPRLQNTSVR